MNPRIHEFFEYASKRWPVWVGVGGALFGLTFIFFLVAGLMTPDLVPANGDAKIVIKGISGQGEHEGKTSWLFAADKAEFSTDGAVQTYHNATATYYFRGRPMYRVVAGEITVDTRSLNYSADRGVRVWSLGLPEKQHFYTESLVWNNGTQMLNCPGDTDLLYQGVQTKTNHLTANLVTGMITTGQSIAKVGQPSTTRPSTSRSP
ncbi:MAG: hypothetical protein JO219_03500 [Candidatus Eremiobacteraeota bacterium]|nr:hypothetical protein [Candidatus Eremiobacteraeota bacterium]MBV8365919.1 hypothetical protein [Candidatus Eremiobacteraeota bacterium]